MAAVDREFDRLAVAQRQQCIAGDGAFFLGAAGQMADAADRQHLRAVFGGRDVADLFAADADGRGFGAEMTVGVDLHLDTAVGENAFGDDRDGVDAVMFAGRR